LVEIAVETQILQQNPTPMEKERNRVRPDGAASGNLSEGKPSFPHRGIYAAGAGTTLTRLPYAA
jgi:hypothetical protein